MNYLFKISILILILINFTACGNKYINIKSLEPAKIKEKIKVVKVEKIENDNINLKTHMENELMNRKINDKRLFILNKEIKGINDTTIKAKILESSVDYDFYLEDTGNLHCLRYYKYDGYITCVDYIKEFTPCLKKDFSLKIKIEVFNQNENLIFSNLYEKNRHEDRCYMTTYHLYPFYDNFYDKKSDLKKYNNILAKKIVKEFVNDISVHYKNYKIKILNEIESIKTTQNQKEDFQKIIELLENKNYNLAKKEFKILNKSLGNKSWEIIYNLALLEQKQLNFKKAKNLFIEAKNLTKRRKNTIFIENSIKILEIMQKQLQKAKLQLN